MNIYINKLTIVHESFLWIIGILPILSSTIALITFISYIFLFKKKEIIIISFSFTKIKLLPLTLLSLLHCFSPPLLTSSNFINLCHLHDILNEINFLPFILFRCQGLSPFVIEFFFVRVNTSFFYWLLMFI